MIEAPSCPPLLVGVGSGVTMMEGVRVGVWSDSLMVDSELVNESMGVVSSGRGLEEAAVQRRNTLNETLFKPLYNLITIQGACCMCVSGV